ncbi:MAG: hypothetical protein AAF443_08870 [Chlamydiota bacterium]
MFVTISKKVLWNIRKNQMLQDSPESCEKYGSRTKARISLEMEFWAGGKRGF